MSMCAVLARGISPAKLGGGRAAARFAVDENGNEGPTAEMEIMRGDLTRILYDAAKDHTAYRFGDRIEAVEGTVNGCQRHLFQQHDRHLRCGDRRAEGAAPRHAI